MNQCQRAGDPHSSDDADGADFSPHHARPRKRQRTQSNGHLTREVGLMRDAQKQNLRRFVGSGSGIHFIRNVYVSLARRSLGTHQPITPNNDLVPGEDDQLENANTNRSSDQRLWSSEELSDLPADPLPTFDQLIEWTRCYFEIWHAALPFQDAPAVLEIFEQVSRVGIQGINNVDAIIVRSIISTSLADSRQGPTPLRRIPKCLVFMSVDEAVSSIQIALLQPTSLRLTQAAVAVQLFLISMLRFNTASRLGGLIVRMAFHLGLHRCPMRYTIFTPEEAQIRRRLFWSIYCLERLLCQSLGLPLDIQDDDVDVCYQGQEMHNTQQATGSREANEAEDDRLRLLMYLAKHARIRGLILELRNKSLTSRQDTADRAAYVQAELAKWTSEIHDAINADGDDEPLDDSTRQARPMLSPSHRILLESLQQESVICLNRPLMASDTGSALYTSALHNCIGASRSIIRSLRKHQSDYQCREGGSNHRLTFPIVWPSFTWALWMSCFILVFGAFEGHLPMDSALRCINQSKHILQHIAIRRTSWPDFCMQAVQELATAMAEQQARSKAKSSRSKAPEQQTSPATSSVSTGAEYSSPLTHDGRASASKRSRTSLNHNSSRQPVPAADAFIQPPHTFAASRQPSGSRPSAPAQVQNVYAEFMPTMSGASSRPSSNTPGLEGRNVLTSTGQNLDNSLVNDGVGPMLWYDQMFGDAFTAIDYPFLAATQLDPIMDPMPLNWN